MDAKTIGRVLCHLNNIHSWEGSDHSDLPAIQESLKWSRRRIKEMTGYSAHELPAHTEMAIEFLKNLDNGK